MKQQNNIYQGGDAVDFESKKGADEDMFVPEEYRVQVYPNPTKNYINFRIQGDPEPFMFRLLSITGQSVLEIRVNHLEPVDISALGQGVYMYEITTVKGYAEKGKVIITK